VLSDKNTYLHIKSIYVVGSSINLMTTNTSNIMSASLSFIFYVTLWFLAGKE